MSNRLTLDEAKQILHRVAGRDLEILPRSKNTYEVWRVTEREFVTNRFAGTPMVTGPMFTQLEDVLREAIRVYADRKAQDAADQDRLAALADELRAVKP